MNLKYGIVDAAGQSFIISGHQSLDGKIHVIIPTEVMARSNVVYDITNDVLIKSKWADTSSKEALNIFRAMFKLIATSTSDLKKEYDATEYGSRTHRSV